MVIGKNAGAVAVEEQSGVGVAAAMGKSLAPCCTRITACWTSSSAQHRRCRILVHRAGTVPQVRKLAVEATGIKPTFVAPDRARYSREHVGSSFIGWLHFQPLYDHIAKRQPDMFA